ncbi:MAG: septum site-determining protein MinD [Ruminococcaceae bacterium]|nr:septum site-determining protein MinD [Oscillospiraceae bacterium]
MSKVIVLASGKGGTGKSTVTVGLAVQLVKLNKRVLLVDSDSGMRGLDLMLGVENELVYDVSDAASGGCDTEAAIYSAQNMYGLYLMPAPLEAEDEISPSVMKELVDSVKDGYDYVLIDSPAGTGSGFEAAAAAADMALVVANPEPTSIRGALNIRHKLYKMGKEDARLVINRFELKRFSSMKIYKDLDAVIDACQTQLIAIVPEDMRIAAIAQRGEAGKAKSVATVAFANLAARLEGENVPLAKKILGIK